MLTPDKQFCELMLSSSCFGREVCPTPPCACAQSVIDRCTAMFMERLQIDGLIALRDSDLIEQYDSWPDGRRRWVATSAAKAGDTQ